MADNYNMLPVQKEKANIAQYQEICGKQFVFKSEVKIFIH